MFLCSNNSNKKSVEWLRRNAQVSHITNKSYESVKKPTPATITVLAAAKIAVKRLQDAITVALCPLQLLEGEYRTVG